MNKEVARPQDPHALEGVMLGESARVSGMSVRLTLARICLVVALCCCAYLAVTSLLGGAVAGCGSGSGCDRALSSHWAYWLGMPVSVPALGIYLCLLATTFTFNRPKSPLQRSSLHLLFALCLLVLSAALWFFFVQRFVIHAWCKFCLLTHASAALAACLLLLAVLGRQATAESAFSIGTSRRTIWVGVSSAMLGLAVLVTGQVTVKKKLYAVTYVSQPHGAVSQQVLLHDGRFRLDPRELPVLGSSTATNLIVSLFDYTCSHCRALHPLLVAVEKNYPGRLGIISLPMPLDATCNPLITVTARANEGACEYARLALAVWHAKPEAFRQFDDWLFASANPPPLDQVRTNAEALVGKDALERALTSPWVSYQLRTDIALYQANALLVRNARLPQLVIGDSISYGVIEDQNELLALITRQMRMAPSETIAVRSSGP